MLRPYHCSRKGTYRCHSLKPTFYISKTSLLLGFLRDVVSHFFDRNRSQIRPTARSTRPIKTVVVDKDLVPKGIRSHWPPRLDLRNCSAGGGNQPALSVIQEDAMESPPGGILVLTPTERARKLTTMSGRFFVTDVSVIQSEGGVGAKTTTDFLQSVRQKIAEIRRHSV